MGRRPKSAGPVESYGSTQRLDPDIIKMARLVANCRDISVQAYLSGLVRPLLTKEYNDTLDELNEERRRDQPPPGTPPDGEGMDGDGHGRKRKRGKGPSHSS